MASDVQDSDSTMSRSLFETLQLPVALLLLVIVAFILFPRGDDDSAATDPSPSPSIVVGEPAGEVLSPTPQATEAPAEPTSEPTPEATEEPTPEATPEPTPEPTPAPTPAPPAQPPPQQDGFTAEVLACQSISGATCNGRLGTLPANDAQFTALVRFTDANSGDVMNAVLSGPSGTIPGGAYTLQGSGDGYYYTNFNVPNMPPGTYTLTATRNGQAVATTTFTKAG